MFSVETRSKRYLLSEMVPKGLKLPSVSGKKTKTVVQGRGRKVYSVNHFGKKSKVTYLGVYESWKSSR